MAESTQILNRRVSVRGTNTVDPVIGEGGGSSELSDYEQIVTQQSPVNGQFRVDISAYDAEDVIVRVYTPTGTSSKGGATMTVNNQMFSHLSNAIGTARNFIGARIEKRGGRIFASASTVLSANPQTEFYDGRLNALLLGIFGYTAAKIETIAFVPDDSSVPFRTDAYIDVYIRRKIID